jgi:hypothetical protein
MARLTHLDVVNRVLVKLGADRVTTLTGSNYSILVSDLVNQMRRRVESALQLRWHDLRLDVDIQTSPAQTVYPIAGYGEDYVIHRVTNEDHSRQRITLANDNVWFRLTANQSTGRPSHYRVISFDSNGDPQIEFYPEPVAVETIRVWGWRGQGEISDGGQQILVPSEPVILGAYWLAMEERGEDGGSKFAFTEYLDACTDAIGRESSATGERFSTDFIPV